MIMSSCTLDVGSGDAGPLHFNLLGRRTESPQLIGVSVISFGPFNVRWQGKLPELGCSNHAGPFQALSDGGR